MFTVSEAAQQLGVCERTAWSYISQRRLLATRISPAIVRVTQSAIDEFLFNCTDQPVGEPDALTAEYAAP